MPYEGQQAKKKALFFINDKNCLPSKRLPPYISKYKALELNPAMDKPHDQD